MLRHSHLAVIERNVWWDGEFETEPYEVGWASEAIGFLRVLETEGAEPGIDLRVQISADGLQWVDEGSAIAGPMQPGVRFVRVSHFGGWLRVVGTTKDQLKIIFSWSLK
jgi:hypothetical protein